MSNGLAVATVTATISAMLQDRIDSANIASRPAVEPGPLDGGGRNPLVIVHLYRVSRNAALYTADVPTRAATGQLRQRPTAALDLHYLVAFRGSSALESEQLLAVGAATLHAMPVLSSDLISYAESQFPGIAGNDLSDADEPVRVCPEALSIDEVTRLWALYEPGRFVAGLALQAGPVLITGDEVPPTVLPVSRVASGARPITPPRIDALAGPDGVGGPVRADDPMPALAVYGHGLAARKGETTVVLVDGASVAGTTTVDDGHLSVPLAGVKPGRHRIQVRRLSTPLDPSLSTTRPAATSSVVWFTVVPTLTGVSSATGAGTNPGERSGTLTASVVPEVVPDDRVRLLLDSQTLDPPVALVLDATWPAPPVAATADVDFDVEDVPAGDYRATLEVNAVRSLPLLDTTGRFVPQVVTV